jgi:histidyl-tRNA synthetase
LPKFFRRYQIQPVWRADRPARGRFREFYQCDIDAMGSTSPVVEAEVIGAVSEVLIRLGFADFQIRLNDRRLLRAVLERAGVPEALETDALVALDKLDKIGPDGVAAEFTARGIEASAASRCLDLFSADAAAEADPFTRLDHFLGSADVTASLRGVWSLVQATSAAGHVRVDASLARGLSYYTGAIMEIAVPDLAGSLGGGGRYDNLIGMFLGRDVPACGFSLGLERIIVVMTERNMFPASLAGSAEILVAMWNDRSREDALALARDLRAGGLTVDLYPDADKPGKQFKYAAGRNCRFVALAGDDEQRDGTVAVKDLRSGAQATVPRQDVVRYLTDMSARTGKDRE